MPKFTSREEYEKWKADKINNDSNKEEVGEGNKAKEKEENQKIKSTLFRLDKGKLMLAILLIIIVGLCIGYILYFTSEERQARNVVDKHLYFVKTGKDNTGDFLDTYDFMKIKSTFINVLDFKYLNTLKKEHVKNEPMILNRHTYERNEIWQKIYKSYEEYIEKSKKLYEDRAVVTEDGLIVESDKYHYEFEFLYDITLTNLRVPSSRSF